MCNDDVRAVMQEIRKIMSMIVVMKNCDEYITIANIIMMMITPPTTPPSSRWHRPRQLVSHAEHEMRLFVESLYHPHVNGNARPLHRPLGRRVVLNFLYFSLMYVQSVT